MIISRKRFEEELAKRREKEEFVRRTEEDIYKLKNDIRELQWKVDMLTGEHQCSVSTTVNEG